MNSEVTQEQKEKIVEELNSESGSNQLDGNTSIFNLYSMAELAPYLKELTPIEMFEKSVALNYTAANNLDHVLSKMSKRNLIKLFFATLKLPEHGATLKFGGKLQDQQACEYAYAQAQLARNALIHVLGTTAMAQARMMKKREEEEAVQASENKEENTNV